MVKVAHEDVFFFFFLVCSDQMKFVRGTLSSGCDSLGRANHHTLSGTERVN